MLQRKQTAFLALAALFLIMLFIFPVYGFEKDGQQLLLYIYGLGQLNPDFFALIAFNTFSIFMVVAIVFRYKNRTQQMFLCKIATVMLTGFIVAIFYFSEEAKSLPELAGYVSGFRPALVFPMAALVLVILANRAIKQDEELVRSADRLR